MSLFGVILLFKMASSTMASSAVLHSTRSRGGGCSGGCQGLTGRVGWRKLLCNRHRVLEMDVDGVYTTM